MEGAMVEWDEKYSVGIQAIDEQHKELLRMANILYADCLRRPEPPRESFLQTVNTLMEYLRYHSITEEQLLEKTPYPDRLSHKKQHDEFIRILFAQIRNFEKGCPLISQVFVRYVRDWVLAHIAFTDKKYGPYLRVVPPGSNRSHETPEMFWG